MLDNMPANDPRAVRSRRDLRVINFLMGNERWTLKQNLAGGVIELGSGVGTMTRKLARKGPVTALDLQEKPADFDEENVSWKAGDLFKTMSSSEGDTVVANLVLHHFEDDELAELGKLIKTRKRFVAVEPWRSKFTLGWSRLLWPFVGVVTRNDMIISIRAGFTEGELPRLLDLGEDWEWKEEVSLLGGLRVLAWRR